MRAKSMEGTLREVTVGRELTFRFVGRVPVQRIRTTLAEHLDAETSVRVGDPLTGNRPASRVRWR